MVETETRCLLITFSLNFRKQAFWVCKSRPITCGAEEIEKQHLYVFETNMIRKL